MTTPTTAPRRPRTVRPKLDAVSAGAVELAREALLDVTEPGQVGEHLRVEASGERLVTHVFECTMPGYRGWSWVAVLARAPRAKAPTVAETALLPVEDAILAPEWEPWSERLKPEDVGADDLMPYREQDERLEQGYEATGDEDADRVALWELGLGRPRVLSPEGRSEAAERWLGGEFGPRQTSDRGRRGTVAANCTSCAFFTKLAGSLRHEFGVCANEWSPADGRVVHLNYGCGAHSETGQDEEGHEIPRSGQVIVDELDVDIQKPEGQTEAQESEEKPADQQPAEAAAISDVPEADSPQDEQGSADEQGSTDEQGSADDQDSAGEQGSTDEQPLGAPQPEVITEVPQAEAPAAPEAVEVEEDLITEVPEADAREVDGLPEVLSEEIITEVPVEEIIVEVPESDPREDEAPTSGV